MKIWNQGKDRETYPCIELDDGTVLTVAEAVVYIIENLDKKNIVKKSEIKDEKGKHTEYGKQT